MLLKFTKFQIRIVLVFILMIIAIIGGGYYYLNSMTVVNGGLNIGKIDKINKIYGYTVYSDYYFHVIKFGDEGKKSAQFSELIPIVTKIGLDFQDDIHPKPTINSSVNSEGIMYLSDEKGTDISRGIDKLADFSKVYGDIISTQDASVFNRSITKITGIYEKLYNNKFNVSRLTPDVFYTSKNETSIPNLKIRYFKLKHKYSFKMVEANNWEPNIAEWDFDDGNRVYLQYLDEPKYIDMDDYINNSINKDGIIRKDTTIIKTTKIIKNEAQKILIKINNTGNEIQTLFMDQYGYLYILNFQARNKKVMRTYLGDYLKIVYGVYFIPTKKFNTNFIKQQDAANIAYANCIKKIEKIHKIEDSFERHEKLYRHFNLSYNTVDTEQGSDIKFDKKMNKIKEIYGSYPSKPALDKITKELNDKRLIKEVYDNIKIADGSNDKDSLVESFKNMFGSDSKKTKTNYIIKYCNSIDCLKRIKNNNWRL